MALNYDIATDFVADLLGNAPGVLTPTRIVNQAVRHLYSLRRWNWRIRDGVRPSLVADQDFVDLPADFHELIALDGGGKYRTVPVSWSRMLSLRGGDSGQIDGYSYAFGYANNAPRLYIYPPPTAAVANAFRLVYRAKFVDPGSTTELWPVPEFMEPLFYDILSRVTRGLDESDVAGVAERLDGLRRTDLFRAAVREDASLAPSFGPIEGGALQSTIASRTYRLPGWGQL